MFLSLCYRCFGGFFSSLPCALGRTNLRTWKSSCFGTNSRQVIPPRVPVGPRPSARSQVRTVVAETAMPRPLSSPTMR